ncbi:MAG: glycosyltransferase [Lachnospiraceae bacterium]|nr:glycosyltransferase [Lachnospiraceae bacterium]
MGNPLVSIIVPVYNTKNYLARCVDSLLGQDYENLEVLLIDDGSTDGSEALLDEYQEKDARVRVIHQENAGVSLSRNRAIEAARGEYIRFVDSDDWLPENATSLLVGAAEEAGCDMVIADFYRVSGTRMSQKGDIDEDQVMDRVEFAAHMIENPADFYYGVLWNKLFRRSIIMDHGIRMDAELSWCEDFLFNLEYIRYAETFRAIQEPVYYYLKRKNSLVSQSMSIATTIRTKIITFEYYNDFYKDVYGDDYEDVQGKVRYYLLSAAKDGVVMPIPSTRKKTGADLSPQTEQELLGKTGFWPDLYYGRRLLEDYLRSDAVLKPLTFDDASLLWLFRDIRQFGRQKEIAVITGQTPQRTARTLSRLKRGEYIATRTDKDGMLIVAVLEKGHVCLEKIEEILRQFGGICMDGLSPEERACLTAVEARVRRNVRGQAKKEHITGGESYGGQ